MSHSISQPRYSAEHRSQSVESGRPLFTLDIYHYPNRRRTTSMGVALDSDIDEMIARLQRIKTGAAK